MTIPTQLFSGPVQYEIIQQARFLDFFTYNFIGNYNGQIFKKVTRVWCSQIYFKIKKLCFQIYFQFKL